MELSAEAEQRDEVQFSVKHFQRPQQGCAVRDKKSQQRITLDTQRCPSTPGQDFTISKIPLKKRKAFCAIITRR